MRVSGILSSKGSDVATIPPGASVATAAQELKSKGIGALVVSSDHSSILGIIAERDLVRALAESGEKMLAEPVERVMTTEVWTCAPDDSCEDLMRTMTDHRARHIPVVVEGMLVGLVSIGDVVKSRLGELEEESRHLHDYISTGR